MKQVKNMKYRIASEFNITIDYPDCIVDDPSRIRNGICDEISGYNTIQCGWDGGDCLIETYPDCYVHNPSKLGDGTCDGIEYNTTECRYDDGDCLVEFPTMSESNDRSNELLSTLLIVFGIFGFLASVWDIFRKRQERDAPTQQQQNIEDTQQVDRHTLVLTSIIHKKVYAKDKTNDSSEITSFPHESIISQRSTRKLLLIHELPEKFEEEGVLNKDNILVNISQRNDSSLEENSFRNNNPRVCPICCEEYVKGDDIAWSKNEECVHAFHTDCIVPWLMDHSDCPMCRNDYLCLESVV
ncbi:hypothetical protein CTEN210_00859 [Chaetoceros tenuissimus]|uniref:RING-type domain-containing protein n=1 Tax=Chaetoceros tenuissimus TaxID=426638 RepID=A0AAD3CGW1_9STRA|nr:hypothetical protein CTEN210_00859 [Chaetoceros tenuissimus]